MRILDLRNKAGITQVELARKIGITPAYLCDLEKGKKKESKRFGHDTAGRGAECNGKRPAGSTVRLTIKHEEVRLC